MGTDSVFTAPDKQEFQLEETEDPTTVCCAKIM